MKYEALLPIAYYTLDSQFKVGWSIIHRLKYIDWQLLSVYLFTGGRSGFKCKFAVIKLCFCSYWRLNLYGLKLKQRGDQSVRFTGFGFELWCLLLCDNCLCGITIGFVCYHWVRIKLCWLIVIPVSKINLQWYRFVACHFQVKESFTFYMLFTFKKRNTFLMLEQLFLFTCLFAYYSERCAYKIFLLKWKKFARTKHYIVIKFIHTQIIVRMLHDLVESYHAIIRKFNLKVIAQKRTSKRFLDKTQFFVFEMLMQHIESPVAQQHQKYCLTIIFRTKASEK